MPQEHYQHSSGGSDQNWWYVDNGDEKGPFYEDEMIEMIKAKIIHSNSLVWKTGMADWSQAGQTILKVNFTAPPPIGMAYKDGLEDSGYTQCRKWNLQAEKKRTNRANVLFKLVVIAAAILAVVFFQIGSNKNQHNAAITESPDVYKSSCTEYSYSEIMRNPNSYIGKRIKISGKILQVMTTGLSVLGYKIITSPVNNFLLYEDYDFQSNTYYQNRWLVRYEQNETDQILKGDVVTFYGTFSGVEAVTTVLKVKQEVPILVSQYAEITR